MTRGGGCWSMTSAAVLANGKVYCGKVCCPYPDHISAERGRVLLQNPPVHGVWCDGCGACLSWPEYQPVTENSVAR